MLGLDERKKTAIRFENNTGTEIQIYQWNPLKSGSEFQPLFNIERDRKGKWVRADGIEIVIKRDYSLKVFMLNALLILYLVMIPGSYVYPVLSPEVGAVCAVITFFVWRCMGWVVKEEILCVTSTMGITHRTKYFVGGDSHSFYERRIIKDVVINENMDFFKAYNYMAIILAKKDKLVTPFTKLDLPLDVQQEILKKVHNVLDHN